MTPAQAAGDGFRTFAPALRERLDAIAREMGIALEQLDLYLIHAHEQLRLDCDHDCQRLALTLERIRPRLLILDPLTRLHQVNENSAAELTPILSRLRAWQQRWKTAVMVVHHGHALRGTSDLHAWGDSYLYLSQPRPRHLTFSAEHRAAPPQIVLDECGKTACLQLK